VHIDDQLDIIGKRLYGRMKEIEITPRILQQRSGLALNSVKTAITGKACNIKTLAAVCNALGWTLFDILEDRRPPIDKEEPSKPTTSEHASSAGYGVGSVQDII
jgi:DNA-binding Xre family transcriptional regulator